MPESNVQNSISEDQVLLLRPEFEKVRLSPDGKYLAITYTRGNASSINILDKNSLKVLKSKAFADNHIIQNVYWMTDDRLVLQVLKEEGYLKGSPSNQYIYSMSREGPDLKQIFPERNLNATSINLTKSFFSLVTSKLIDGKYILIAEQQYGAHNQISTFLRKVNIFNGQADLYDRVDMEAGVYAVDTLFRPRLAMRVNRDLTGSLMTKNLKTHQWRKAEFSLNTIPTKKNFDFLSFNKTNDAFYHLAYNEKGFLSLYLTPLSDEGTLGDHREIASFSEGDLRTVLFDKEEMTPLFYEYGPARPERKYLSQNNFSKTLQNLDSAFPNEKIYPADRSPSEILLFVKSDRRAPTYYLYDKKTQSVREILSSNERVRPTMTVPAQPVSYKSRDGVDIYGFLYTPKNQKPPYRMIIYIHGGPYGVEVDWGFSGEMQYLVQQGFAVLAVNYRGSSGRGLSFEMSGYKKMSTRMQEDIADAVLWAFKKGLSAKGKVGTWGASYGAYSAVMSGLLFPDLISAAAGFGGVYNLSTLLDQSDARRSEWAINHWMYTLSGSTEDRWKDSPISKVEDLQIPIYLAHGSDDVRCPIQQAEEMRNALEKNNKTFEYKEYANVGHWFTEQKGINSYFETLTDFFNKNLK